MEIGPGHRIGWQLATTASADLAWATVSDVSGLARTMGYEVTLEGCPEGSGAARRMGVARGLRSRAIFEEERCQYRRGQWVRVCIRLVSGPVTRLAVSLRVAPDGAGARVYAEIHVTPRRPAWSAVAAGGIRASFARRLRSALRRVLRTAEAGGPSSAAGSVRVERAARAFVAERMGPVLGHPAAGPLADLLLSASDAELQRIHPATMAERWGMNVALAAHGLLAATGAGLLELQWEVACPTCRAVGGRAPHPAAIRSPARCARCGTWADRALPGALEVSFRPTRSVRALRSAAGLHGTPAGEPHVLCRDVVFPGEILSLSYPLAPGSYQLRTTTDRRDVLLDVGRRGGLRSAALELTEPPARLRLSPGPMVLRLANPSRNPIEVVLEARGRVGAACTAGRFLELPGVAEALDRSGAAPGLSTRVTTCAVLVVSALRAPPGDRGLVELARRAAPDSLWMTPSTLVATFAEAREALAAVTLALGQPQLRCAVGFGPVVEAVVGGETLLLGAEVEATLQAAQSALPDIPAIAERVVCIAEVRSALRCAGAEAVRMDPSEDSALLGLRFARLPALRAVGQRG